MRRLHTLTGAIGLGVFLVGHLLVNASVLRGWRGWESTAGALQKGALGLILDLLVFGVLGAHVVQGIRMLRRKSTPDDEIERFSVTKDHRFWVLQRMSAVVVLGLILLHVFELRFRGLTPQGTFTVLSGHLSSTWKGLPWIAFAYVAGIALTLFHFSNGLFAAWAANTEDEGARRRIRRMSIAVGFLLFCLGTLTVMSFATGTRLLPAPVEDSAPCP